MAAPSDTDEIWLLWDLEQDPEKPGDALRALIVANAGVAANSGLKQLTAASANGKSFSYTIPPGGDAHQILMQMASARRFCVGFADADAAEAYLAIRPPSRTVSRGVGFVPANYPC
jgi:hypothetical protein